tara:strand:+ start:631 stop:1632 length:1002 start_codon:yes stop_codon:yes gene_type:complete
MGFIDKVSFEVHSGNGGPGCISFHREKYITKGGPDGGDGGKGGDVIFKTSKDLQTLLDLKHKKKLTAQNGQPGERRKRSGKKGSDIIIEIPCGTLIYDENNTLIKDMVDENDHFIAAKGGRGGLGNQNFATARKKAPRYAQDGQEGEEKVIHLELRMIAEVGLVGFPNAGKSTLLKSLTKANPKIAAYPFTTLHPNLGILKFVDREIVIADIPGIIEGASTGSGLGHDFLRHIDRTKILIHLIDISFKEIEDCLSEYKTFNEELKLSQLDLLSKPQILVLSKCEMVDSIKEQEICNEFKKENLNPICISAHTQRGLNELKEIIQEYVQKYKST